ncbi:single-stranded-DNA-specific exonuclease RecJ [Thermoanaerobacterium thermosaccharolyticum]|uniref:single-stranded-DNA-specific exonuclease RecJ n=1 Tax=Thermoanaerobacterium thermosaccharolyticum TaxID=1517 RepID=UPI003D2A6B5C
MLWQYNSNTKPELNRTYPVQPNNMPINDLVQAILGLGKVAIFGDYDVDGICSSLILKKALDRLGIKNIIRLPERSEGYGLKPEHIHELKQKGFDTILTVDNGITAFDAAEEAEKLGVKLIITDHHEPKNVLPKAYKVFDPKLYKDTYKDYAGAGVAYLIARELLKAKDIPMTVDMIELAGLATVADVVPLDSNNWYIARKGLEYIRKSPVKGIKEILRIADRTPEEVNGFDLGWVIAPRINACGRLKSPVLGLNLLLHGAGAEKIEELNQERLKLVKKYIENIKDNNNKFLMYIFKNCREGIIGLIAGRVAEMYQKPVLIGTLQYEQVTASVRTYGEFDLLQAFEYASKNLDIVYGGHKAACGVSFNIRDAKRLQEALNKYVEENPIRQEINLLDGVLLKKPALEELQSFDNFEPFGYKNPEPAFLIDGTVTDIKETMKWRMLTVNNEFNVFVNGTYKTGDNIKIVVRPYINGNYVSFKLLDEKPEVV